MSDSKNSSTKKRRQISILDPDEKEEDQRPLPADTPGHGKMSEIFSPRSEPQKLVTFLVLCFDYSRPHLVESRQYRKFKAGYSMHKACYSTTPRENKKCCALGLNRVDSSLTLSDFARIVSIIRAFLASFRLLLALFPLIDEYYFSRIQILRAPALSLASLHFKTALSVRCGRLYMAFRSIRSFIECYKIVVTRN